MEMQCDFHSVFMKSGSVNDYLGRRQQGSSLNRMDEFLYHVIIELVVSCAI